MRWIPQAFAVSLLGGCVALNPAYGDERSGTEADGKTDGSATSEGSTHGDTTKGEGSSATSTTSTSSTTASSSGSTSTGGDQDDSSSGGEPVCPENGFDMRISGVPGCRGNAPFDARLCVQFSAAEDSDDALVGLSSLCTCDGMPTSLPQPVEVSIADQPLADLILQGETTQCAMLRLSGVGSGGSECEVRSAFFFEGGTAENLTAAFSNDIFVYPPLRESLADLGLDPVALFADEADCGGTDPICDHEPGYYDVALAPGEVALHDGPPVEVTWPAGGTPRTVRLYNFSSRVDSSCEENGRWGAVWAELPHPLE